MIKTSLLIPKKIYHDIHNYLFPKKVRFERVTFIFTKISKTNGYLNFQFKSWYPVKLHEYEYRSRVHVELKDRMRQKIIKMAFDIDAAIVELHSHVYSAPARFSPSDFQGFEEFVPHVWWRLKGKPYAAIVFSKLDFDALVWIDNSEDYEQLAEIVVGKQHLYPNGLTLTILERKHEYWTF